MATLGPGGTQRMLGPGGTEQPRPKSTYDFSTSNLILMIGGQILILVLLLMVVLFGVPDITSPIKTARQMIKSKNTRINL